MFEGQLAEQVNPQGFAVDQKFSNFSGQVHGPVKSGHVSTICSLQCSLYFGI